MKTLVKLPIDQFNQTIVQTVKENAVTIIVAQTGAGKSTRVPQFLLNATDWDVVVTQPRRVAAKSVARRVADEMGCRFGGLVGFRTAVDRNDSHETRCLFATDGLQLVRELTDNRQTLGNGVCLVIDEVHEWNQNIETLVAWAKRQIQLGADIKVVLMSATLDHERLSEFFDNAPVIEVPGRCFPVVGSTDHADGLCQKSSDSMFDEIRRLASEGRNTLVFLPGKGEIAEMERRLLLAKVSGVILPLHGDLSPEEQDRVFNSFSSSKIVLSTNLAQTSITISDIDAVVDSGLERRIELRNGVETLVLGNISKADVRQRAGRAGRVKEGVYVLCNNGYYDNFNDYSMPEIQRTLLDQMVLRLAANGLDALELPFYHQPLRESLVEAKTTLQAIEALDKNGNITKLGEKINRFPTNVKAARMLLEAVNRKCLGPVMTIAAIMGTNYGSIRRVKRDDDPVSYKGWESHLDPTKKYLSDYQVELELYYKAKNLEYKQLEQNGISAKGYGKAAEVREQLHEALCQLGYMPHEYNHNARNEEFILKCIASGMVDHLYRHYFGEEYLNGGTRTLGRESILHRMYPRPSWIVGEPKNIQFKNRKGRMCQMNLVVNTTAINPMWMIEIAPHLVGQKVQNLHWDSTSLEVVEDRITIFNGQEIMRESKRAEWSENASSCLLDALVASYYHSSSEEWSAIHEGNVAQIKKCQTLWINSGGTIDKVEESVIRDHYALLLDGQQVLSIREVLALQGSELFKMTLDDLIGSEKKDEILRNYPEILEIDGQIFPITYRESFGTFTATIAVTEEFLLKTQRVTLSLPNGNGLQIACNGFVSKTVSYVIEQLFATQFAGIFTVPSEMPWYEYGMTRIGQLLKDRLDELKVKTFKDLGSGNVLGKVEVVRTEVEAMKAEIKNQHDNAQALIAETEESFKNALSQVFDVSRSEVTRISDLISQSKSALVRADFDQVKGQCNKARAIIPHLFDKVEVKAQIPGIFGSFDESNPMHVALKKAFEKKSNK